MSSGWPHRTRVREVLGDASPGSAEDLLQDHQNVEVKRCSFADVTTLLWQRKEVWSSTVQ